MIILMSCCKKLSQFKNSVNLYFVIIGIIIGILTLFISMLGIFLAFVGIVSPDFFVTKIEEKYSERMKDKIESINKQFAEEHNTIIEYQKNNIIKAEALLANLHRKTEEIDYLAAISISPTPIENQEVIKELLNHQVKVRFDQQTYLFYLNKGIEEYKRKNPDAIYSFNMALSYYPNNNEAFYRLALSYKDIKNDKPNTIKYLQQSVEYGFGNKDRATDDNFENFVGTVEFNRIFSN